MAPTPWLSVIVFAGLALSVTLYGLAVSGHFPAEHRGERLRGLRGAMVLWGTMLVAILSTGWGLIFAAQQLPWYASVIVAGAALLVTPLLLRPLPDSFVNGRCGLLALAAAAAVMSGLAWRLAA
jgi:hypothetical protein